MDTVNIKTSNTNDSIALPPPKSHKYVFPVRVTSTLYSMYSNTVRDREFKKHYRLSLEAINSRVSGLNTSGRAARKSCMFKAKNLGNPRIAKSDFVHNMICV